MIQLRLAWWRDRLREPAADRPLGEPLLAILNAWDSETAALIALSVAVPLVLARLRGTIQ